MAGIDFRITGLEEAQASAERFAEEAGAAISEGTYSAALEGQRVAKQAAPVDTGALESSIGLLKAGTNGWRIYSPLVYAPIQNWGGRGIAGSYYMEKGAARTRQALQQLIRQALHSL